MIRIFLYLIGALLICLGGTILALNLRGYQYPQMVPYSAQDLEKKAINYALQCILINPPAVIKKHNIENTLDYKSVPAYVIPYNGVEHFLMINPNCCEQQGRKFLIKGKIYYRTFTEIAYVETNIAEFYITPYLVSTTSKCY